MTRKQVRNNGQHVGKVCNGNAVHTKGVSHWWLGDSLFLMTQKGSLYTLTKNNLNFPGGSVIKNLPVNAEDTGLILCKKILHVVGHLSPCNIAIEIML